MDFRIKHGFRRYKLLEKPLIVALTILTPQSLMVTAKKKSASALKDVRDNCVIATKTGSRTKKESLEDVKSSLRRLQTYRIDIIQLHGIDDEKTLSKAMGQHGSLQTCKQTRSRGLVDFIGITWHKPQVLLRAIETGEFDTSSCSA